MTSPLEAMRKKRKDGCLSDFAIDALVADDLPEADAKGHRAHLATCDDCSARLEAATAARERFAREAPVLAIPRKNKPNRARVQLAATSVLALAAAALLYVQLRPKDGEGELTTRLKGSSHIGFYVKHGDVVTTGVAGSRVKPGDALRFTYQTASAGYLAILSVDGAKNASVYFPDGPTAAPIEAGSGRALPTSTVLDDTLGHETLYALFCDSPIAIEPVRAKLAAFPDQPPAAAGCTVDSTTIDKDAASKP